MELPFGPEFARRPAGGSEGVDTPILPLLAGYWSFGQFWGVWVILVFEFQRAHGISDSRLGLSYALTKDLPGVGAELIDHCMMGVIAVPKPGIADLAKWTVQAGARYTATGSDERNDMQLVMTGNVDLTDYPDYLAIVGAPIMVSVLAGLQRPKSRGRLVFTSADPKVQPRIELDYCADPEDLRRLVDGLRLAWKVANQPQFADIFERIAILTEEMMRSDKALEEYVRGTVNTIYHPVATCRMGPDGDAGAVVDQHCRVRGIEGLRVVDASVMPSIPRANTNVTCIMIGERVADWMKREA